jgi:hypothetical protein
LYLKNQPLIIAKNILSSSKKIPGPCQYQQTSTLEFSPY